MGERDGRPERGGGSRCSCTALRKATRRITQLYDTGLAGGGLRTTQRAILAQIKRSQPTTVGSLAEALVMDSGALAHTLKPLERDGFVAMAIDPEDRRNRLITLSPSGEAKLAETDALWSRTQAAFETAFGKASSDALREALQMLISDEFATAFKKSLAAAGGPDDRPKRGL